MARYRYEGEGRAFIPDAAVEVEHGEEFETDVPMNNPLIVLVEDAPSKPEPAPDVAPEPAPEQAPAEEVAQ